MFGISDYGAFVVAVILFLMIPGPGNLALITSTGKSFDMPLLASRFVMHRMRLPELPHADLLHAARAIRADLPVALASGYVTTEIEQAALAAGARALIHKPNDVDELCATVDRLLHDAP